MSTMHVDLLGCQTRFYDTGRYRTRVIEGGAGTPLILLHGGGASADNYTRNMARLAAVCRPMAMDFIWHGLSSAPAFVAGNWLKQLTEQVLDLLDHLGIDRAAIEGHSLGGWVALDLAINHPDRVGRIVLNCAWGMRFQPGTVKQGEDVDWAVLRDDSINALKNLTRETMRKRVQLLSPHAPDELVDVRFALWSREPTRTALIRYYEHLFDPKTDGYCFGEADLAKIRCPALLLFADRDQWIDLAVGRRAHEFIAGSEFHAFEDSSHWLMGDHPEKHDALVTKFLKP